MLLIYNGISLSPVKTADVTRRPVYSDDGVEYKWTEFTISVSCVYNPGYTAYGNNGTPFPTNTAFPITTDASIRHYLMQPRKTLYYGEPNDWLIFFGPIGSNNAALDCDIGPKPLSCNVVSIGGDRIFWVTFSVQCAVIECPSGGFLSPVASSRYSRTESIDLQIRSTLTTSGITYFRANVLAALATDADAYRGYIIPPPILGYQRVSTVVNISPDGLALQWTTVDLEQFIDLGNVFLSGTAASYGIVRMELINSVGNPPIAGNAPMPSPQTFVDVQCTCFGMKAASTFYMALFAVQTIYAKLSPLQGWLFVNGFQITEDVFNNIVTVAVKGMYFTNDSEKIGPAPIPFTIIGNPISTLPYLGGQNPYPPFSQGTRGETALILAAHRFSVACYTPIAGLGVDETGTILPPDLYIPPVQNSLPAQSVNVGQLTNNPGQDLRQLYLEDASGLYGPKSTIYTRTDIKDEWMMPEAIIPGLLSIPVSNGSGQNQTLTTMNVANRVTKRKISFSFERLNSPPEIPNPTTQDNNYVLIDRTISTGSPETMGNGKDVIFRTSGSYTYAVLSPVNLTDPIPFSPPPSVNATWNQSGWVLDQAKYYQGRTG